MVQNKIKTLPDCYTYNMLNGNNRVSNNMIGILKSGSVVTNEQIEEALMTIRKNFKYKAKADVLNALANGDIALFYAPDNLKITTALPFFLTQNGSRLVSVVLVDSYGVKDKDTGNIRIDPKKLYVLLEAAYFGLQYIRRHNTMVSQTGVISSGSSIYAGMIIRMLNRKYALNQDRSKHAAVTYLASKFFMINLLGMKDGETVSNYAYRNTKTPNKMMIEQLDNLIEGEEVNPYGDIHKFVSFLGKKETGLRLEGLTTAGFLEQFIQTFQAEMLLALEYLPMFIYNINAVVNVTYINNQAILDSIVEKEGDKFYNAVGNVK